MQAISNTNSFIDDILPPFGRPCQALPTWDESQKMFIGDEYESAAGNRYYKGVRFSNRIAMVVKFSHYHTWTYVNQIDLFAFNGREKKLIGSKTFEKEFYDADVIREQANTIVANYILSQSKMSHTPITAEKAHEEATRFVGECYQSFLRGQCRYCLEDMMPLITAQD